MPYFVVVILGILFILSPVFRCAVFHPFLVVRYAIPDIYRYFRQKKYNYRKTGNLDIFCGYFGFGKTLSLVHTVVCREYRQYNGKKVWDDELKKFVTQRVIILSNVQLNVPFILLESLSQVVDLSKSTRIYDVEHGTRTVLIVCMDELSVQMNSRSFKDNVNPLFLNTLMCCRHYGISFYGSAQRFFHVDKLLRDVTMNVVQCRKLWRFQSNTYYDAFDLENAQSPTLVKPIRRTCWFVRDSDYQAYDTRAVVDNLQKKFAEGDLMSEEETLALLGVSDVSNMDAVARPSRRWKKMQKRR